MRIENERVYLILKPLGFIKTGESFKYKHESLPLSLPFDVVMIQDDDILIKAIDYISVNHFNMGRNFAHTEIKHFINKC